MDAKAGVRLRGRYGYLTLALSRVIAVLAEDLITGSAVSSVSRLDPQRRSVLSVLRYVYLNLLVTPGASAPVKDCLSR